MEDVFRTEEMAGVAGAAASPDAASDDFSGTNVQELGVDEADLVKNDGQYIYSVGGRELIILRAKPTLPSDGGDAPLAEDAVISRTQLAPPGAYLAFAAEELLDAGYAHLWYTPLHARTLIASEGGCSVGGAPIAWAAAAASHETIYCDVEHDGEWCKPHDPVLSERECATLTTMDTFDNLLHKAASCCGYPTCESGCEIEYDECALWM